MTVPPAPGALLRGDRRRARRFRRGKWSEDEIAVLTTAYRPALSARANAESLRVLLPWRTVGAIQVRLCQMGLGHEPKRKLTPADIAPALQERLRLMVRRGRPTRHIAHATGLAHSTIVRYLHVLALRRDPHAPRGDAPASDEDGAIEVAPGVNIRPAQRRCLRCRRLFDSEGPHNRICERHRPGDDPAEAPYRVALGCTLPGGGARF